MTDRELLELAAKAAEYVIESFTDDGAWVYEAGASKNADGEYPIFLWRPRHDDGDALRLAVKLGIDIGDWNQYQRGFAFLRYNGGLEFWDDDKDPCAATRRAIVSAAASIRKGYEMTDCRLADEVVYFGGVQDGAESQKELIESLRQQLADTKNQVNQLNSMMRDKGFGQGEIDIMGWYEQQITLHECVHRQITANENLLRQQLANAELVNKMKPCPEIREYTALINEVQQLRQQLAACQAECEEEARLNGMGGSWEAALMASLAEAQAREKVLLEALEAAAMEIMDWGRYAAQYFQDKHDLVGTVAKVRAQATRASDDSAALNSALRKAKREALLEAGLIVEQWPRSIK